MHGKDHDQLATSLAAVFEKVGQPLVLRELPIPSLGEHEALVRITCSTLCGSDLHTISGARQEPLPTILGHEAIGTVAAIGKPALCDIAGQPLQPGERVTWSTCVSCGHCDRCSAGLPQKCRSLAKYGHERADGHYALSGGLAEFIVLRPGSSVLKISPEIPNETVCPVNCATATIAAAFRTAGEIVGKRVLLFGAGMLGLTAAAFAHARAAARITLVDPVENRLAQGQRFGASDTVCWSTSSERLADELLGEGGCEGFDIVLELSGAPQAVDAACRLADIGGRIILVGSVKPSESVPLNPEQVVRRWLSIHGVHNYVPQDLQTAVGFFENNRERYPFAELVEKSFTLAEINDAVEYMLDERPVRIAVYPPPKAS
jgi:putative phosphonate catabolism associated alcohol dehydrogenase